MAQELSFANTSLAGGNRVGARLEGWPVAGAITQVFGQVSVTGARHGGIDIAAPRGAPVRAPAAGILARHSLEERDWQFGNWVVIDHPGTPWYSAYAHLFAFEAAPGPVAAGDVIGYVGESGLAFGAHLHWAVSSDPWFALNFDALRDPADFIPGGLSLEERVARLERLLAGNGVRLRGEEGDSMLTGEPALARIDSLGHSIHLGLDLTQELVAALAVRLTALEKQSAG